MTKPHHISRCCIAALSFFVLAPIALSGCAAQTAGAAPEQATSASSAAQAFTPTATPLTLDAHECATAVSDTVLAVWAKAPASSDLLHEDFVDARGTLSAALRCIYGVDGKLTMTVSIEALTSVSESRAEVEADLQSQGMTPTKATDGTEFTQVSSVGVLVSTANLVSDDSWIKIEVESTDNTAGSAMLALTTPLLASVYGTIHDH